MGQEVSEKNSGIFLLLLVLWNPSLKLDVCFTPSVNSLGFLGWDGRVHWGDKHELKWLWAHLLCLF